MPAAYFFAANTFSSPQSAVFTSHGSQKRPFRASTMRYIRLQTHFFDKLICHRRQTQRQPPHRSPPLSSIVITPYTTQKTCRIFCVPIIYSTAHINLCADTHSALHGTNTHPLELVCRRARYTKQYGCAQHLLLSPHRFVQKHGIFPIFHPIPLKNRQAG